MADFAQFKQCMRAEANLDLEALDVMFIQPLKDLDAWWQRQSEQTRRYLNLVTTGIGGGALAAFLARILSTTVGALSTLVGEALGAVMAGIGLGLFLAAAVNCGVREIEAAIG